MMSGFEKKVAEFVEANGLFIPASGVLLAVSGGADSTALLYAMQALKAEELFSGKLLCVHINHRLRGAEADTDEDFVIAQTAKLNLPITTRQLDVCGFARRNKLSIETAARKLRLESLLDIAKANGCNHIATGHQKNDNAETIIQRLGRGTGIRGLAGIWPVRSFADDVRFARPLLCVGRDEIVGYLRKRNLKWRTDKTNKDCTYRRNYIRHHLLPALQKDCSGSIAEQLFELSQSARRFYKLVCDWADKTWPALADYSEGKVKLDLKMFLTQPMPVRVELIRRGLTAVGSGERDLRHKHYERILELSEQNVSGRKIELPGGFVVWREYGSLIFARPQKSEVGSQKSEVGNLSSVVLEIPGQTRFGRYLIEATIFEADEGVVEKFKMDSCLRRNDTAQESNFVEWFDLDKIKLPLVVRFRQDGDKFWPLGLAGEKKVGKFLTAAKVPQELRQNLLIVADNEKTIWLWPIRVSEQTKITAGTRRILQLQIASASSIG